MKWVTICRLLLVAISTSTILAAVDVGVEHGHDLTNPVSACGDEFSSCLDSGCCKNPGFGCYKRAGVQYAQCKRKVEHCEDTSDWICPENWALCTDAFGDCRASTCCRRPEDKCVRRGQVYYAQCRPQPKQTGAGKADIFCTDPKTRDVESKWLCPGWEMCAKRDEECTLSRCCSDPKDACYLDQEKLDSGTGWHAYCRPSEDVADDGMSQSAQQAATTPTATEITVKDLVAPKKAFTTPTRDAIKKVTNFTTAVKTTPGLCEGASQEMCSAAIERGHAEQQTYRDYIEELVVEAESDVSPLIFGLVILGALLALVCVIIASAVYYFKMKARATQLELELEALRAFAFRPGALRKQQEDEETSVGHHVDVAAENQASESEHSALAKG